MALRSSGRNEEALFSYLHCVAFEKKLLPEIREDIVKVRSAMHLLLKESLNMFAYRLGSLGYSGGCG